MHELLAKFLSGNASDEERELLEKWRAESEANALEFLDYKETWQMLGDDDLSENLTESEETPRILGWSPYLKYAATVVLLALIGALWFFNRGDNVEAPVVFAGISEVLQDGTIVSLKDGAEIVSVDMTGEERVVKIKGKAFFEVKHDAEKPFYVITNSAKIKVLGTSFLVNSYIDFTEVCVESGSVNFSTNTQSRNMSLNLEKGEMGVIGKDIRGIVKRQNDNLNFLAWKDGIISFERAKIIDVAEVLEDTYGKSIVIPRNLEGCRLTAKFNKKSLDEVIQILSATFNWSNDISKEKVVLSGEGC